MPRGKSGGRRIGNRAPVKDKYGLGTDEEVRQRTATGYQPSPTSFGQIGPGDRSENANEPQRSVKSGDFKFTSQP